MNTAEHQAQTLRINEAKDGNRPFLLHCENGDVICSNGKQIIDDTKLRIRQEDWLQEVNTLHHYVESWVEKTKTVKIQSWILIARSSQLVLFFCPEGESFDFDLAEALAGLSSHVARNYATLGAIELLQVAYNERDRFFNPDWEMFNGNLGPAHPTVEA